MVFGLTRPGIEPESTVSAADALYTRSLTKFVAFNRKAKCSLMLEFLFVGVSFALTLLLNN